MQICIQQGGRKRLKMSVTYLPKDVEHFETYALYGRSRGAGAVGSFPQGISNQSSSPPEATTVPRSPQQEIVDLMATALLRLRVPGPPPSHPSQTPTVNEVGKEELARRRFGVRVLNRMTDED